MTAPAKRRYVLAASDAPASASGAADAVNALCVALYRAESERDELIGQLAATRAELAEARGSRLSSVLAGCCAFIEQRDALRVELDKVRSERDAASTVANINARIGLQTQERLDASRNEIAALRAELKRAATLNPVFHIFDDTEDSDAYPVTP